MPSERSPERHYYCRSNCARSELLLLPLRMLNGGGVCGCVNWTIKLYAVCVGNMTSLNVVNRCSHAYRMSRLNATCVCDAVMYLVECGKYWFVRRQSARTSIVSRSPSRYGTVSGIKQWCYSEVLPRIMLLNQLPLASLHSARITICMIPSGSARINALLMNSGESTKIRESSSVSDPQIAKTVLILVFDGGSVKLAYRAELADDCMHRDETVWIRYCSRPTTNC